MNERNGFAIFPSLVFSSVCNLSLSRIMSSELTAKRPILVLSTLPKVKVAATTSPLPPLLASEGSFAIHSTRCGQTRYFGSKRPAYLKLSKLREKYPDIPCLALTATATPTVRNHIAKILHFKREHTHLI